MNTRKTLFFFTTFLVVLLLVASVAAAAVPKRVLIVVMDQMHPEYAQQYNMTNVLWLEKHGAFFPNAYVGDMASETVVSHNVMVSGLFPNHMGWSDEAFRDANGALGTDSQGIYITGSLSYPQFGNLIAAANYPKLGTYLQSKFPNSVVACVGEKNYQVRSMLAGTSAGDKNAIGLFLGSRPSTPDPAIVQEVGGNYRPPSGINVPKYISEPAGNRFYVRSESSNDYGTRSQFPSWIYPEDGNRMVPGTDPKHLGGDTWVADAAIKIMQNEKWSGLFVNFGGIDKIGHMWGGGEFDSQENFPGVTWNEMVHESFIAKNADDQLGRLIATLKKNGQYSNTLIVLTADHGSTYAKNFYGQPGKGAGDYNWYYGNSITDGSYYNVIDPLTGIRVPPVAPALQPLIDTGKVAFSYQSTAIETWVTDPSAKEAVALAMRDLPGVIATYVKSPTGFSYDLDQVMTSKIDTASELSWLNLHGQELVDTMAWPGSADVVGLLADNSSYGAFGDHGGAQMDVQRIPMAFSMPGIEHTVDQSAFRLVDVMPTVLKSFGIQPSHEMDGQAYTLPID